MKFKVSDIVRVLPPPPGVRWGNHQVGDIGVVVAIHNHVGPTFGQAYILDITPATHWICEACLELIPHGREQFRDELGEWELCPWKPPIKQPLPATTWR